jgi:hypothetical protein
MCLAGVSGNAGHRYETDCIICPGMPSQVPFDEKPASVSPIVIFYRSFVQFKTVPSIPSTLDWNKAHHMWGTNKISVNGALN